MTERPRAHSPAVDDERPGHEPVRVVHPTVSVIIANYNYGRFLSAAIDSVLAQTTPPVEVIVVDDGSTDGSRDVIATYGSSIASILKPNGGQASAFNVGFAASGGDLVWFLDADDYLFPGAVRRVLDAWRHDVSKLHFRLQVVDGEGRMLGTHPPPDTPLASGDVVPVLLRTGRYASPVTSGNVFARPTLERLLPIPEDVFAIGADGYLNTAAPFYGPVIAVEDVLAAYRIHGANAWLRSTATTFRASVDHDRRRLAVLERLADERGVRVGPQALLRDAGHVAARLASLRLEPQNHPFPHDQRRVLLWHGAIAYMREYPASRARRVLMTTWLLCVGLLPGDAARAVLAWQYDRADRPAHVARAVRVVKRLFTSR